MAALEYETLSIAQRKEHQPELHIQEHGSGEVHEVDLAEKNDLSTSNSLGYFE